MKTQLYISIISGAILLISSLLTVFLNNTKVRIVAILIFGILLIILFLNFLIGFIKLKRHKLKAFLPFIICMFFIIISLVLRNEVFFMAKKAEFHNKRDKYNSFIKNLKQQKIPMSPDFSKVYLPTNYFDLAYNVRVKNDSNGILAVEFMTGGDFPAKHYGYLYVSSGIKPCDEYIKRWWPHIVSISSNWFLIGD